MKTLVPEVMEQRVEAGRSAEGGRQLRRNWYEAQVMKRNKRSDSVMPELPEVETVKRTLNELITGKTIDRLQCAAAHHQRPDDPRYLPRAGGTVRFNEWSAAASFCGFCMDDLVLVSHLRMEGRYGLYQR